MSKSSAQIVTANRLRDGAVVYLAADGAWSEGFGTGALFATQEAADAGLARAAESVKARLVVEPYLIDVAETVDGPKPVSVRERIRADRQPTFKPDAGSWAGRIGA